MNLEADSPTLPGLFFLHLRWNEKRRWGMEDGALLKVALFTFIFLLQFLVVLGWTKILTVAPHSPDYVYFVTQNIQRLLQSPSIPPEHKLRLVALYGLRYERHAAGALPVLLDLLTAAGGVPPHRAAVVRKILAYRRSLTASVAAAGTAAAGRGAGGGTAAGAGNDGVGGGGGGGGGGAGGALSELFEAPAAILSGARERFRGTLKGVENVYTQHAPRLAGVLQSLIKGRLRDTQYPFFDAAAAAAATANTNTNATAAATTTSLAGAAGGSRGGGGGGGSGGGSTIGGGGAGAGGIGAAAREKPQDIIVFVVGGATYEEARMVAQVNASSPGVRVVLGGTTVHNSATFMEDVEAAVASWP
jgi:uncharacterized membrane protein YgcG